MQEREKLQAVSFLVRYLPVCHLNDSSANRYPEDDVDLQRCSVAARIRRRFIFPTAVTAIH